MKKRILMLSVCMFAMAPAVFGGTVNHGIRTRLRDTSAASRECSRMSSRNVPDELSASRDVPVREGRIRYGSSAKE